MAHATRTGYGVPGCGSVTLLGGASVEPTLGAILELPWSTIEGNLEHVGVGDVFPTAEWQ